MDFRHLTADSGHLVKATYFELVVIFFSLFYEIAMDGCTV